MQRSSNSGCGGRMESTRASGGRGFTLVELLVVIAIIGLLFSMLLPVLNQAKIVTLRTLCTTHQRGIGQSLFVYEADYKIMPAYGTHGGLGLTNYADPFAQPFGGGDLWGPLPQSVLGLGPGDTSTTNGPLGIGMLVQGNYLPLEMTFCPQYDYMYDNNNTDQGANNNWHKRQFIWGASFTSDPNVFKLLPGWDGLGLPTGNIDYLRSDYNYRGGEWSTTGDLASLNGIVNAVPGNLRSQTPEFNKHSLLTDWRYWAHPQDGSSASQSGGVNVTWGDGSVSWMDKTRWGPAGPSYHNLFSGGGHYVFVDLTGGYGRGGQSSYLPNAYMDNIDLIGR